MTKLDMTLRAKLVALAGVAAIAAITESAVVAQQLSFYTVTPCRLVDTRNAVGSAGGPAIAANGERAIPVGGRCGVSSGAKSVSLNLTVTGPTADGLLILAPAGPPFPGTSTINFRTNVTRANSSLMALGEAGALKVLAAMPSGQVHFILDVNGYFADPAAEAQAIAPAFDPPPGSYTGAQSIAIVSSTPGATIRYTTDGSTPNDSSPLYSGPVALSGSATLKAFASKSGLTSSPVTSGTYAITLQPTLYLATLTSQCAGAVLGSGNASLLMSGDQTNWDVKFQFSNLTGTITSKHVHAPDTQILHDLDSTPPDVAGNYHWTLTQVGTWSAAQIRAALAGGQLYLNLHTGVCPNGEIKGFFKAATGGQTFTPPPAPPPLPTTWNSNDAARFLTQTTFGPQMAELNTLTGNLASQGATAFSNWIDAQMALSPTATRHIKYLDDLVASGQVPADELYPDYVMESIWNRALFAPDQLRKRVGLALSEILVISDVDSDVWSTAEGMATYLDLLETGAFGNYRTLLEDVTLSPTMGVYLDMLSNDKGDPETGAQPNENFARELLQLFSIGLYQLHPDGTLKIGADGLPIATYGQEEIKGFAQVFTGWTHSRQNQSQDWRFYWPEEHFRERMQPWESHHETGPKRLLDGIVQAGGQPAINDLTLALNVVFNHPNVGPFVCKQLIQRLVTSNPTPAYVYRCGQAFANNGVGVRGDMKKVIKTILMDYEARTPSVAAQTGYGKLKEPIVRFGNLMRSLNAWTFTGDNRLRYYWLDSPEWGLGQNPLRSTTVFNFFEPTYAQPGEIAQAGLVSPEFKITTETTAFGTPNFLRGVLFDGWMADDPDTNAKEELLFDWSQWTPLTDAQVLDRINVLFYAGSMSSGTRTILAAALADPDLVWPPNDRVKKIKEMIWLTFLSPESLIQK